MARIFQTASIGEAHVRACIVSDKSNADLLVYRVSSWGLAAGDPMWYITKSKQDATCWIYFTSQGLAELSIYFVDNRSDAGWQKAHKLHNKLG